ncbi:hypothetical protein UlMin_009636 [Ulmus minor]
MEGQLVGSEIHGFHTLQDLDVKTTMEEAKTRWLRPNEIYAILSNHNYFAISVKPVNLPKSGKIVLFDRKKLRNFRKDGHNWKKKKDGKTVKEAHEHLKVGNDERIHVYYAHGQDNLTFVRRCYWLLDKSLEHIVLVHYRETQELQGSPVTPVNSSSSSVSDPSAPWILSEEGDTGTNNADNAGEKQLLEPGDNLTVRNNEQRLYDINTLEWDELLAANDPNYSTSFGGDKVSSFNQQNQVEGNGFISGGANNLSADLYSLNNFTGPTARNSNIHCDLLGNVYVPSIDNQLNSNVQSRASVGGPLGDSLENLVSDDGLHGQDSFGRWINQFMIETPGSVDDLVLGTSISSGQDASASPAMSHIQPSVPEHIFTITDMSPEWAYSKEKTKILVTGFFHDQYLDLAKSNLFCVCGDACVPAEIVQAGVYRCFVSPHSPGLVNLFMSVDGHKPISQVLNFEYHAPILSAPVILSDGKYKWDEFQVQSRLAMLLFSTSKSLNILSSKVSPTSLKEAKKFVNKVSNVSNSWDIFTKSIEEGGTLSPKAKDNLFKLVLRDKLKEWLLERILDGSKTSEYDSEGLGVIHLCAVLGYTWAIHLFSLSGLSLDFRDKRGWTALHWAAYCGNEKMVGALLAAGAKPNLVTDPTKDNPGGCTTFDLASSRGYDGLAAYLSEKSLVEQFNDMSMAGNITGTLETSTDDAVNPENLSEELYMKDSLAAYRTAADAAARIQSAFREHALKLRTIEIEFSTPEEEARSIIAAMQIQHAFRNFETRKKIVAAGRIQHRFRSWKIRKEFLNMRRQAIKIQAAFRGFQMRRQYQKIIWSVGVLEKVILRWRLKRKGFRGLQVNPTEATAEQGHKSDTEEDFYKTSQKQANERVEKAVVKVQSLFRSKKAQEEYQMMKLAHYQAKLEYEDLFNPDIDMSG